MPPAVDVHGIRAKLGLTQDGFATSFGFTVSQIREWEQGRNRPAGAVRAYLMIIDAYPERVREMLRDAGERAAA